MKEYILNYYSQFKCVAGECKHTCCAGWEMCIDSDSIKKYQAEKSDFSQILNNGINYKKSKFRVDKKGRCVFLNDKGLCEIIINLGEESLCQVCRDHPRFRSYFNDRIETGIGFSCPQGAKIILSSNEDIKPILISDDKIEESLDFDQINVLKFRQSILDIVQDKNISINDKINGVLKMSKASFSQQDFKKLLKLFSSFERCDKEWTIRLKKIKKRPFTKETAQTLAPYCQRFLENSFYRHLSDAEDTMWVRARAISCVFSWWIIKSIIEQEQALGEADFDLIVDVVRAYSTEVEYSKTNLDKLYAFAYRFMKL